MAKEELPVIQQDDGMPPIESYDDLVELVLFIN